MNEPKYVITTKNARVGNRFEKFYRVVCGSRKVCEIWLPSGGIKKSYDRKGKLSIDAGSQSKKTISGPSFALAFTILRDAFDQKTALEWASTISFLCKVPADHSRYDYGVPIVIYTRSDLFTMILEAQQTRPA